MKQRFKAPVVAVTEENTYVVASVTERYFCFEAPTEAEAIGLARQALAFWNETRKAGSTATIAVETKKCHDTSAVRRADELTPA